MNTDLFYPAVLVVCLILATAFLVRQIRRVARGIRSRTSGKVDTTLPYRLTPDEMRQIEAIKRTIQS